MRCLRRVFADEWPLLRTARLRALRDAPYAFGSRYEEEVGRPDHWWRSGAERLAWFATFDDDRVTGIAAGVPPDAGHEAPAVISMWVEPGRRGTPAARHLLAALTDWARQSGARTLGLGVAETNARARRFYEKAGFTTTGRSEPLRSDPRVSTAQMVLALRRPRLRAAPSPAGDLHVGHVRVAVLTWVLARRCGGEYFVRFENTDDAKERPGARPAIMADLEWLGLSGDEPPHDQSAMTDSYRDALGALDAEGWLYQDGDAVRFRVPREGSVCWDDLCRGLLSVSNADLVDPVLVRRTGSPTFHLASTVDDVEDEITHVLRPEAALRLSATQRHVWHALGTEGPRAGHLPLVTKPDGSPVRFGEAEWTIKALRAKGVSPLPLAVYLAMPQTASWKVPPRTLDEIVDQVELRRLPRRPTRFDLPALARLGRRMARTPTQS